MAVRWTTTCLPSNSISAMKKARAREIAACCCQLTVNKKTKELLEIETFQNPWNMVGFIDWNKPQ